MFEHLVGNDHIKKYLLRMIERQMIVNALLFSGPDGVGKSLFAEVFAKLIICQEDPTGENRQKIESGAHPDIYTYRPEGKVGMHSIDSMRQFSREVYLPPYIAQWKIFIIHDADRMLKYSANALLKTFEEPGPSSIIILLSKSPEALLPTVVSRCHKLHFNTVPTDQIAQLLKQKYQKSDAEANLIAVLARGSIGNAIHLAEQGENTLRKQLLEVLTGTKIATYMDLMEFSQQIGNHVEEMKQELEESARNAIKENYPDGATSIQQHAIEKEVEGMAAMHLANEAAIIFDTILSWYRDMHLMCVNGDAKYLLHPDFSEQTEQALQRGKLLPLEAVQAAISQAKLGLERSTSLSNCLENLFLQLNFLR